jgi:hypothetical protein
MPIWKLTPIDLDDPNWESSSHRGLVVVRAPNEGSAREVAERAFGVPTRFPPGKGMRVPPWMRSELVRAEIIDSPIYPAEGPTEVLEPFFKEGE